MIDYTKLRQQLKNVILAQEMWATIPKENVNLNRWQTTEVVSTPTCGTIACFGGWCSLYPAFQAQGVFAGLSVGTPTLNNGNSMIIGEYVAEELFGDYNLFDIARDANPGNHHNEVTRRLVSRRSKIEQELLN